MEKAKFQTLEQIKEFLDGTTKVAFHVPKAERNTFIEHVLKQIGYACHGRSGRGVLLRYIERMTGLSRQQVTRLVRKYSKDDQLSKLQAAPKRGFVSRFTAADVALIAEMDSLHTLTGPATKKLMERAYHVFGDVRFERLADISVSHLYNLRGDKTHQSPRRQWTKTPPTSIPIDQRRAPQPNGSPGYIRIDSVHQGNQDDVKGMYYINAVDCVTQFQVVATCEKITEAFLLPVIGLLLDGFPFVILEFYSDNGSEYINYKVAQMLQKVLIEFTKSRTRQPNDNAFVESKNETVVGKHIGDVHISQHDSTLVNTFCAEFLNPYVNYHRPCFYPETVTDAKGKERKEYRYNEMMTPFDKFKSIPNASEYLKLCITFEQLDMQAVKMSDNDCAFALKDARKKLLQAIATSGHV